MSNRESVHRLVDTLPEAALASALRVLQNYQLWPPQPPADVEKLRERLRERLERSAREQANRTGGGVVAGSIGGSHFRPDGDGAASMAGWDGETLLNLELRVFRGYKLELEERFRISDDRDSLLYSQKITGPRRKKASYEIEFDIAEGPNKKT